MVRETRHLWVGNLPDNIREERIREHFKRYGRVQSVKLLARGCGVKEEAGEGTMACTVAFMDIKSASKAHNVEHKIDDRTLTTEYYEPAAIPSAASPQNTTQPSSYNTSPASTRFPNGHGSADEHSNFSERFYERGTTSGGGGGGGGGGRGIDGEFIRRSAGYHETSRGRNRDRAYRSNGPYNSGASSAGGGVSGGGGSSGGLDGGRSSHRAAVNNTSSWSSYDSTRYGASQTDTGYASAPSEGAERRTAEHAATKKKAKSRSGSGSPSPSGSTSSRSPSRSRSRSSSSSSSSSTSRDTSSTGSPKSRRLHSLFYTEDRRPLAICVRNLPIRSSDTSLKDGLFHEYKKHGKVTWVKMVGQSLERYAIVCFKKPQDVEKALEVSYDKLFFGCKIEVGPYQGYDDIYMEETDFRPYEAEIDEFHPKATRTLFIGNLEKDVTASDLRKHFDQFGEIIEIDIKKQGTVGSYAFCQYTDIGSVVQAIRKMDGEHLGNNRIKLGFGKSMPTGCVWVDGIVENVNEKYLKIQFEPFGTISKVHMDRERGQALMFYDQVLSAQTAVNKMRGFSLKGSKIQVDFASRECQEAFFEHLDKQGTVIDRAVAFDERRESASRTFEAATTRFASRYDTPTRPRTSSYSSRSSAVAAGQVASAVPSPGTPGSMTPRGSRRAAARYAEYYEQQPAAEYADRHFRSYDEYSQGSAASHEDAYDHEYVYNHDSPSSHQDAVPAAVAGGAANGGVESAAVAAATPFAPPDIRNLQKERVHLLEQLEECPSSGDELLSPKKRLKLDVLDGGAVVVTSDVIIEANRDHRKVMEVRRLSDVSVKHHSRRPSADGKHSSRGEPGHDRGSSSYLPHAVCKRRKTAGSDGGCTNTNATTTTTTGGSSSSRTHHYDHSGSESAGGSRPGTPLCDERPDHFPPAEPRRTPRDREGPLSLPLPRFASQLMLGRGGVSVAGVKGQAPSSGGSPPAAASASAAATSPRTRPPSPVPVPPPASPPPRPPSLSPDSSDSDGGPPSPSLDERIRSLDEKYEKWSGSRALGAAAAVAAATQGGDALAKLDATRERFRRKHNLLDLDLKEVQPSEIVKSVLAKRSVFDEDSKRLENVGEKYEPKEFGLLPRVTTTAAAVVQQATATAAALTAAAAATAAATAAAAAAAAVSATPPVVKVVTAAQLSTTMLSPRSAGATITPAKGLQYPFPSHPLPQTTLSSLPGTSTAPAVSTATTTLLTTSASTASTTNRGVSSHGENRLKPCVASVSSDNRTTSKVTVNRNVVVSNATSKTIEKTIEKPSPNIPNTSETSSAVVAISKHTRDAKSAEKGSEKITCRRDSNSSSPRGDIKTRRNSDTSTRKVDEAEKYSEHTTDNHKQDERAKEEEHKEQLRLEKIKQDNERLEREKLEKEKAEKERLEKERQEKERLEKERLEKERLEKERQEKERLERQRQERERQERERLEKERLEKQRLEKEEAERQLREKLEKERLAKEKAEKEKAEQEKREKEKQEQERIERERRKEREERERLERERYERELREKAEREKQEQLKREREEKERVERERLEKERFERIEREKHEREKKHKDKEEDRKQKDDNHHDKQRKDDHRNHSEQLKENNFDKHSHDTKNTKDNKEDKFNTELHEKSKHDRKDHVKENRDSNLFRNLVTEIREGKDRPDKPMVESRHMSIDYDKSKSDKLDSGRRKDKYNNLQPSVGSKRRMSSHDISESFDEAKRFKLNQEHKKLSERRDSKDSTRSDEKSKSKHKNNSIKLHDEKSRSSEKTNHVKNSEEKRKEKDRDKEERHKLKHQQKLEKQKSKTKNRERDLREWRESPNTQKSPPKDMTDTDFMARLDLQLTSDIEKHKQQRKELKDGKKLESSEPEEKKDEKRSEERTKKEKHSSDKNKIRDDSSTKALNDERKSQKKGKIKKLLQNSSDNNTDSDEPKKHSIFDIVDDEPAYISMYDKVKARSCKNMQKQEEEKRQEKIKAKFSQLKQSRAKREEKKRSTSWDEDSDSDREKSDMKLKRALQALIISSDDDDHMIRKLHKKVDMFTDSDSDVKAKPKVKQLEVSDDEKIKSKHKPKSCITSDTLKVLITSSDDDDQIIRKLHKKVDIFTDSDSDVRGKAKVKQLGVSDDEKMKSKHKPKSRITSDTSDDEFKKIQSQMKTEMFSDNEVDQGFADSEEKAYNKVKEEAEKTIKKERKNKHLESLEEQINAQIFGDSSSPFPEIKTEKFNNKHFDNSSADESMEVKKERSEIRKKHKKKQKRQKHSLSSEESKLESLGESMHSESSERSKIHEKKKQHSKKDKKRDKSKDERDKTKKKKNKAESKESKRDGKIENIFGSFSEDSETGIKDQTEKANVPQPWEESRMERIKKLKAYLSDSECEHYNHEEKERDPKEEHKKRKEKKRREKERRLQEAAAAAAAVEPGGTNENSMDFADMGKQVEENIKENSTDALEEVSRCTVENSVQGEDEPQTFPESSEFHEIKKEEKREGREKKKKRKKSKEEKQKHHHHHHEKKNKSPELKREHSSPIKETSTKEVQEAKTDLEETKPHSQSLPTLLDSPTTPTSTSKSSPHLDFYMSPFRNEPLVSPIPKTPTSSKERVREKLIPGFGADIDEKIHENAVKSISAFEAPKPEVAVPPTEEEEKPDKAEETPEEKPRVIISQEETEDAVAALLGESFRKDQFDECYNEESSTNDPSSTLEEENIVQDDEEMRQAVQSLSAGDIDAKPDTPQSEHELQIDTDTEEQEEIPVRADQSSKPLQVGQRPVSPKSTGVSSYYQKTPPLLIKTTDIGSPPSLAPITPSKSLQPAIIAEVKRTIEIPEVPKAAPVCSEQSRSVISWSKESKEAISCKAEDIKKSEELPTVKTVTPSSAPTKTIIASSPLRTYGSTPVVKLAEPIYPPLTALSSKPETEPPQRPEQGTPMPSLQPMAKTSSPSVHILPARSPVPPKSPITSLHQETSALLTPKTTIANLSFNRLPVTPVMISKPLQSTTINLPQPKVAHSIEHAKLVPITEGKAHERPRLLYQNATNVKAKLTPYVHPQPRMVVQPIQITLPPQGLLVPARPLPSNHMNYLNNVLPTLAHSPVAKENISPLPDKQATSTSLAESAKTTTSAAFTTASQAGNIQTKQVTTEAKGPSKVNTVTSTVTSTTMTAKLFSPVIHELPPKLIITSPTITPQEVTDNNKKPQIEVQSVISSAKNECLNTTPVIQAILPKTSEPPSLQPISQPVVSKVVATAVSEIPVGNNLSPKDIGCKDNQKAPAEVPKCLVPGTVIVAADQKESVKETPKEDSKVAEEPSHLAIEKVTEQLNLTLKKENDDDHPVPEEKLVIPENIISEVKPEVKPESLSTKDTEIVDVKQSVDDTKSVEAKSVDVKSAQVKPVEVKSAQVKSVEVKSVEVKSVEIKPVEIKPVDIKPVEIKPVDIKPVVEVKSVEVKSVEAKSVEAKSAEIDLKVEPVEPEIKSEIIDTKPLTSDILDDMKKEDVTKEEIKAEPSDNKSVISEADSGISSSAMKESDKFDEEKADTESIISDISKERSSAELGMKYDPLDSKEDSDYWSAKEVNIDSVIKILCSADELSNHSSDNGKDEWFDNVNKESQEKLKEVKSVITENPLENDLDAKKTEENSESVPKPDQENLNDSAESIEDKDVTTSLRSSRSRGGRGRRGKARGGIERVGVQTRRAKVIKEPVTPSKRGGRNAAKTKVERRASKSDSDHTADVYEFRDDSDENNPNKERPRLILTIKSPSISGTNNTQTTIVKEVVKEITTPPNQPKTTPENKEEFLSPINTRKSRRLQERDGSRNTVDDTIEDVVKNTRFASNNAQTPCTRRSTRQVAAKTPPQETAARKSPRSARRRDRRGSEANEETPEEKDKVVKSDVLGAKAESEPQKEPEKPKDIVATTEQHSPKEEVPVPLKEKPHVSLKAAVLRRVKGELQQEPMTLIDPVTGLLTPMRECEEGRYIPVPGEQKQAVSNAQTSVVTPNVVAVSQPQRPVPKSVITLPQQQQPQPAPAPQPAVPPQVQAQNPPQPVISKPKPQSLKAHVLSSQAAKAVVQTSVPQPQKAAAITPQPTPPMIITKASTPISQHLNINVSISNHTQSQASPRQQTVPLKVVTKVALQVKPPKGSPCQVVSFTNQQKQQILQQVKQPTTMVTKPHLTTPIIPSHQQVINTQMAHMKHTPPQLVMQQVLAKGHITKASALPMHQQQMLAGAAASPPPLSKTASQPIPTAVSSARILPVSAKGVMEPPKVDVSVSNIILGQQRANLSPQGQPRHVVQPGMSVPGYEASLGEAIAHFPPGSVPLRPPHDLPAAHYMHPSHVMQYQQFLRQSYSLPRSPMVPGGLEKAGDGQEGEEAPVTSPPLELRRAGSVGLALTSRSAAVPHGLHSPHDRATDSPQVGQVYNMHTARMQHYHPNRFFEQTAEPPPAHRPLTSHGSLAALGGDLAHMGPLAAAASVADRPLGGHVPERPLSSHSAISSHLSTPERPLSSHGLALGAGLGAAGNLMGAVARHVGVDAPATQRGLQAATPPHASQVPPQAESLFMLLKQYPCMWQGLLALKNDQAAVQMYFVSGNEAVAKCSLPKNTDGSTPPLRIFQRMRLEPPQVEGVARKMQMENEHCMLLALPCGHDHMDVLKQSTNLTNGFITYLQQKQAAGIVNVAAPGTTQPPAYVVHIFPSCDFVNDNLRRIAPSLLERVADIAHLLIVITTV